MNSKRAKNCMILRTLKRPLFHMVVRAFWVEDLERVSVEDAGNDGTEHLGEVTRLMVITTT
jgi:hypothetical protein